MFPISFVCPSFPHSEQGELCLGQATKIRAAHVRARAARSTVPGGGWVKKAGSTQTPAGVQSCQPLTRQIFGSISEGAPFRFSVAFVTLPAPRNLFVHGSYKSHSIQQA